MSSLALAASIKKNSKFLCWTGVVLLVLSTLLQMVLFYSLILAQGLSLGTPLWLGVHILATVLAAIGTVMVARHIIKGPVLGIGALSLLVGLTVPVVGALGLALSVLLGSYVANKRNAEEIYWQTTNNIDLPFTTPIGRKVSKYDSRGFVEQLMYSDDSSDLYKKVLSASNIKATLSVSLLKKAVEHTDDKIRLTAYQTLDRKVSGLNREIQRLEQKANDQEGLDKSNTWLQIASNYWELLTLEKEEPIARRQLLSKAAEAAQKSISILPDNRNAHFTLGRILLMQRNPKDASAAFTVAMKLGMPREKIMPYLAEAAFDSREYHKIPKLLNSIDDAFKHYPPLSHVAQYWQAEQST